MSKKKIGYMTFGRDDFSYGIALVLSKIDRQKYDVFRVTPKTARLVDVLLFSIFWWEHYYNLASFLRLAGIEKKKHPRPRIIIGGFNTFSPVPLLQYADAVVVGDGEEVIEDALEDRQNKSILRDGDTSVEWATCNDLTPFILDTSDISRVELCRGCRYKCKFCAVGHLKRYRELPVEKAEEAIRATKSKRISLFAPEPTLHSNNQAITELCERYRKIRQDSDIRIDRIGVTRDSVPRVGLEGLSERLRKSVNKPYTDDYVIEKIKVLMASGAKGIFFYLILDLPGETDEDWEAFRSLLTKIGNIPGSDKFLIKPSPSVFLPTPHTPLGGAEINWDRDYAGKWWDFFRGGERLRNGKHWEAMIAERCRVFRPHSRVLSMAATRAGAEFYEMEKELYRNKAYRCTDRPTITDKRMVEKVIGKYREDLYCGEVDRLDNPVKISR